MKTLLILCFLASVASAQPCRVTDARRDVLPRLKGYEVKSENGHIVVDSYRWAGATGRLDIIFDSSSDAVRMVDFKAKASRSTFRAVRDDIRATRKIKGVEMFKGNVVEFGNPPSWFQYLTFTFNKDSILYMELR